MNKKGIKIAIQPDNGAYSIRWIEYCEEYKHPYLLVDCFKPDIVRQLEGCTHFLWNFQSHKTKEMLFAKQLLYSIEKLGIKVFPNFNTMWHYDDKIGQKYLLDSVGAPFVNTSIFYDKVHALNWANSASFPVVFKLSCGAGSANVKLIHTRTEAKKMINSAFSNGISSSARSYRMKENWRKFKKYKSYNYLRETFAGIKNYVLPTSQQILDRKIEKGYFYVQEFLPDNSYDIRIFVIGARAVAIKRLVRENDFRASGSGEVIFEENEIDIRCVKIAFDVTQKLNAQAVGYDFIFDQKSEPKIVEISYASLVMGFDKCNGYWDKNLKWNPCKFKSEYWMMEDILAS